MTCPVCKRELAPTLSICYACGTMVQDSVREELATKIGRASKPLELKIVEETERAKAASQPDVIAFTESNPITVTTSPVMTERPQIAERAARPRGEQTERISRHTSQTLVGFQNPRSNVPDWRLHLQNAIRQRKSEPATVQQPLIPGLHTHLVTNGANALKAQVIVEPQVEPARQANLRLENAMKRIEDSRRRFSSTPEPVKVTAPASPAKNYPFNVVESSRTNEAGAMASRPATPNTIPKPRLVSSTNVTPRKALDTNKLPAIPYVTPVPVASPPIVELIDAPELEVEPIRIEIPHVPIEAAPIESYELEPEVEEIDDLAALSVRFTAGLFDVIIAAFGTAILMSPLLVSGGEWLSAPGIIAIAAAFGIVTFTYLTVGIGLRGRTLGMKIFSLEVIDIEANEYPTFHQSAVRAAVFLLGLPLLGIGFLPAFFNEERRAAHDLVSGTILVREL